MASDVIEDLKIRLDGGPINWPRPESDRELFERSLKKLCDLQAQVVTHAALLEQLRFERTEYERSMLNHMTLRLNAEIASRARPSVELVAVLQANNKKLTEERDKAKEELDDAKEDIANLRSLRKRITELNNDLSDRVNKNLELRKEIKELKETVDRDVLKLHDARQTIIDLKADLNGRINNNIALNKKIKEFEDAQKNPICELGDLRKEIKRLNEALAGRVDEVVGLRAGRHEWHVEKDRLIREIKDLNAVLDNPVNDVVDLRKTIQKLEIELAEHRRIWPFVKRAAEEVEYAAKIGLPK